MSCSRPAASSPGLATAGSCLRTSSRTSHSSRRQELRHWRFPDIGFWDVVDVVSPVAGEVGRASGVQGTDVLEGAARAVLGDTLWDVLHVFARGLIAGLRDAPKDQLKRISDKFGDFGLSAASAFTAGYSVGVLEGLWHELKDLVEAIKTLIGLPAAIGRFLTQTLPKLAMRLDRLIEQPAAWPIS